MKKKNLNVKLILAKESIVSLTNTNMDEIKGKGTTTVDTKYVSCYGSCVGYSCNQPYACNTETEPVTS